MKVVATDKIDEGALPVSEGAAAVRRADLARHMVDGFLRHVLDVLEKEAEAWRRQIVCTPRGADFDLRDTGDGTTALDALAASSDALGEALARGDAATDVGQSVLPYLAAPVEAMAEHREAARTDAKQQAFLKRHAAVLNRLEDDVSSVSRSLADLAAVAARGAASLDPDATRRAFNRMRTLGDAMMRLIEDRIISAGTREEGKRLRALRDDLKSWIEDRNARLDQMQTAVDELSIRSDALRNAALIHAKRLTAAAALARQAAGRANLPVSGGGVEQASPEAMVLSAGLRALLLEGRADVTAPLRES